MGESVRASNTASRGRLVFVISMYVVAAGLTAFGLLENPHTWSAWWIRNGEVLFNCQYGWSIVAQLIPALLIAGGSAGTINMTGIAAAKRLRWLGVRASSGARHRRVGDPAVARLPSILMSQPPSRLRSLPLRCDRGLRGGACSPHVLMWNT